MGSRNRQRATFEKRQRELQRQERQAEKRAKKHGQIPKDAPEPTPAVVSTEEFPFGAYPEELEQTEQSPASEAS